MSDPTMMTPDAAVHFRCCAVAEYMGWIREQQGSRQGSSRYPPLHGSVERSATPVCYLIPFHMTYFLTEFVRRWPTATHLLCVVTHPSRSSIYLKHDSRDTLRPLVAGERSSEGVGATQPLDTPYPNLRSELQFGPFGEPFPVGLSPSMYDPELETAPNYPDNDASYNAHSLSISGTQAFSGEGHNCMYGPPDLGFVPPGNSSAHVLDFNEQDFDVNMMDAHTLELWSHAPPRFG